jgi:hypothetical protein
MPGGTRRRQRTFKFTNGKIPQDDFFTRQVIDQRLDAKEKPPKGNRAAYHPAGDRRQ